MRDFFINAFEKLVAVIVILMGVFVVVVAMGAAFGGGMGPGGSGGGGVLMGLFILAAGAIYVVLIGGAMYLGLGIYQNTKRTAELLERMAAR